MHFSECSKLMWAHEGEGCAMLWSKKLLLCFIALPTLISGLAFTSGTVYSSRAASALTSVTDYPIPSGIDPWGTAFDSSGKVWVAVSGCDPRPNCGNKKPPGQIEVFNPTTSRWIATYQLPSGYGQPLFLAFDANGNIWFPMFHTNTLGMFNTTTTTFQQWTLPTANSGPWDIAIDHNGYIWITEHYANKIARFDPNSHVFTEVATPATNSQPYGITVDANNNIWFTENNSAVALIGEYTATGQLLEYKIRNTSSTKLTPHLITIDPNGNIWWTEGFAAMIGELKISLASPGTNNGVTEYAYPKLCSGCGRHTSGISVDSKGLIWFDDSLQSTFGSFLDTGTGTFRMHKTPSLQSHPHDGLRVDSQNRIWFDEENAGKLAEVVP
jgi:streptogramin lyase